MADRNIEREIDRWPMDNPCTVMQMMLTMTMVLVVVVVAMAMAMACRVKP